MAFGGQAGPDKPPVAIGHCLGLPFADGMWTISGEQTLQYSLHA